MQGECVSWTAEGMKVLGGGALPQPLLEGAAGQLQRGRHCYTILLSENAI